MQKCWYACTRRIFQGTSIVCEAIMPLCQFVSRSDNFTCILGPGVGIALVADVCAMRPDPSTAASYGLNLTLSTGYPSNTVTTTTGHSKIIYPFTLIKQNFFSLQDN